MPARLYVNLNLFLIVNINVSINNFSFKYICVVCYLKLRFFVSLASEILILKIKMLMCFKITGISKLFGSK